MNLLSLNGEAVTICPLNNQLLVFDVLYIEDLKPRKQLFEESGISIKKIELDIFEWSDGSLLGFYSLKTDCESITIDIKDIKYHSSESIDESRKVFSTDSGLIAVVSWNIISAFLDYVSYDDLVDILNISPQAISNYITKLSINIGNTFAIISTPGVKKGFDFQGSGQYIIDNECIE